MNNGRQKYLQRTLAATVERASGLFPVVLVTGPRQVGKTTLLRQLAGSGRRYVTLDDPRVAELAVSDPALFLERFPPPLLVDEIQHAPGLLPYIKMHADAAAAPGSIWLTGSQQFNLMHDVSESLAGRVAVLRLAGLSRREARGEGARHTPFLPRATVAARPERATSRLTLQRLYAAIHAGSFPQAVQASRADHELLLASYLQTYVERDVRALINVGDARSFVRFVRAVAARTAQLLNIADLARDSDIAPTTAKRWLSILEASALVYLLEPYHSNVTKRLVKAPKLYFLDTGLCAFLTAWQDPVALEAGAMAGAMFETWAMGELLRSYWHNGLRPPFYFYRDKDQAEIDLLIARDGHLHPVEFKKSASPRLDDCRAFATLARLGEPVGHGALVCLTREALPLSRTVTAIPAADL